METEDNAKIPNVEKIVIKGWSVRHQQCFLLFCSLTAAYSMRTCMGVSLVAMTGSSHSSGHLLADISSNKTHNVTGRYGVHKNDTNAIVEDYDGGGLLLLPPYPIFRWNKKTQDVIQSSFFWGYMIMQVPAGQLVHHFGARYLITSALLINCVMAILMPWAAYYGGWILIAMGRVVQGLSQACLLPGIHTFLGKWAPIEERGRMSAFIFGGQVLGTVLGLPITGFIASSPLGWPGIFRFYGFFCGVAGGFVWWLNADTPAQHKSISALERRYIEEGLGQKEGKIQKPIPWRQILRCRGLYAIIIAHIGGTWGQLTLYTQVPAFMDKVMGVNIKANGLLTALPFLVSFFTNFFFSWLTDMFIVKGFLSVGCTRKVANTIGHVSSAVGLIVLAYVPKDIYIVEPILVLICGLNIASHLGFHINHVDISPNYSGTLMSISNFMSNMFGSLAPIVAGLILTDASDDLLWRRVFFVAAGLFFFTNLGYVILGSGINAVASTVAIMQRVVFSMRSSNTSSDDLLWRRVFFVAAGLFFFTNLGYVILGSGKKADWDDPDEEKEEQEMKENGVTEPMLTKSTEH